MTGALPRFEPTAALTAWTPQPVAIAAAVVLVVGYVVVVRRAPQPPAGYRVALYGLGVVLFVWATCGVGGVYSSSLFWVWTSQTLLLWLGVPIALLAGWPVQLARTVPAWRKRVDAMLRSRFVRVVGNPLVGPALVPVLSFAFFFGPLAGWAIAVPAFGWVFQLVALIIGALMVLPLVGLDEEASSLAVGLSLLVGAFELVLDALPGIVLRLKTTVVTTWFDQRDVFAWTPHAVHDQAFAGGILWCIAELIDLPFLVLVFRRWLRADARDAARVDAVLAAERAARAGLDVDERSTSPDEGWDTPWWLTDPGMQRRLGNRD